MVPPMINIDDGAFRRGAQKCRVDRLISWPPRRGNKYEAETNKDGDQCQRQIGKAGEPAARHERVEERVVRVFREEMRELQRSYAQRTLKAQLSAEQIAAKAAVMAEVIGLL